MRRQLCRVIVAAIWIAATPVASGVSQTPPAGDEHTEGVASDDGSGEAEEGSGGAVAGALDAVRARFDGAPDGEALGSAAAAHVLEVAQGLIPRERDRRIALVRAGETNTELAEALGLTLVDLTNPEAVRARIAALQQAGTELDARIAEARLQRATFAQRANELFHQDEASGRVPSVLRNAQVGAARRLAAQHAAEAYALEGERAFVNASVDHLEHRLVTLEATLDDDVSAGVAEQKDEIAAERQRLETESALTDAVAQRAREAEERARAEAQVARDEAERAIAERWATLAPRLQMVVEGRTLGQDEIAQQTARREEFAAGQVELSTTLESILAEPERAQREARADAFVDVLIGLRRDVRLVARERRMAMREAADAVAEAEQHVADLRREVEDATVNPALGAELRAQLLEVGQEEIRVLEEELGLARMRRDNARSAWNLNEAQIHFYARVIDRLIPELSDARARAMFSINRTNLGEARANLQERIVGLRLRMRQHTSREGVFAAGGAMARAVFPMFIVLCLLVAVRLLPRHRDSVVIRVVELRTRRSLRRFTPQLLKAAEVVHEAFQELLSLLASRVAIAVLAAYPLPNMVAVWWFWIAVYRAAVRIVETMVVPRAGREPVLIGEPPDEVRLGVDVFDFTVERARLIVRTTRLVFGYLVLGRVGLAAVRFVFGPGFFFYWAGWLFSVALLALVYAIAWYWRKAIVDLFIQKVGERGRGFGEWLNAHQGKFYSVLVVIILGAALLAQWLAKLAVEWLGKRGIGQFVTNFAVRKKLERAVGDTANVEAVKRTVLPVAYQRVFRDTPLTDEAYLVPRTAELAQVRAALEAWEEQALHGTIAVIGDAGSGKTTFANHLAREFAEGRDVVSSELSEKLLDRDGVFAWFNATLGLACDPERASVLEAVEAGEQRVVIVDQCENLFLRSVGGFDGVDEFLDLCTLTNHRVFWVLCFDRFPWSYLHRVRNRRGYFREIVSLKPFNDEQLKDMIDRRNKEVGVHPNFDRMTTSNGRDDQYYELVKTAAGYFRILAEYSRGNLRVAQFCWLQSLLKDPDGSVHVTLFARPDARELKTMDDERLFALTALVQHRSLTVGQVAQTLDLTASNAEVIMNLLRETGYIEPCGVGALRIATRMYFPVISRLRAENFLHLDG